MFEIDFEKCKEFATIMENVKIPYDDFTSTSHYPPLGEDIENVARYFFFMTAIDHRTSRPDRPYQALIGGKVFKGADLLYRLGAERYLQDREFFSPKRMSQITSIEVSEWLNVGDAKISDPEIRAFLLRDAALKLLKLYDGSVMKLIETSSKRLYAPSEKPWVEGFIERLRVFRAYEDPVEKKSFLLYKFLERRGIFEAKDKENIHVPVDNHLTRIAIRFGLVVVPKEFEEIFLWRKEADRFTDIILRFHIREAYKEVSRLSGIPPTRLDDFLWMHGRNVCTTPPLCEKCPLKESCNAYRNPVLKKYREHYYLNTWYY